MTKRTISAGLTPTVIIKAGSSVTVEGWDREQVQAETQGRGGLQVGVQSEAEVARARAAVGEHVLFDLRLKLPGMKDKDLSDEAIVVQIGNQGRVQVPLGSRVKVYAGKDVEASNLQGSLAVFAGGSLRVRGVQTLAGASAGGGIDLECEALDGAEVKVEAGRDLRCHIRSLTSARVLVNDLGGYWEGLIGDGELILRLKAGGDATLVTDQPVESASPNALLGQIERPAAQE